MFRSVVLGPLAASILLAASAFGCSGAGEGSAPAPSTPEPQAAPEAEAAESEVEPMRVLVTGFNDWKELGEPPNVWRCRDNPSCRLLVGEALDAEPSQFDGPLAARLRERAPRIEWRFATMPVTWGVFAEVPRGTFPPTLTRRSKTRRPTRCRPGSRL